TAAAAPLKLTTAASISKDNAALPRIAGATTPGAVKVNAALARLDARWRAFVKDCRAEAGANAYTTRSVEVTMASDKVLAMVVASEGDCGGAHPNADEMGLAYDVATGRPLDWTKLLPKAMVREATTDSDMDGTVVGAVVSPALHALYLKSVNADFGHDASWKSDCGEVLENEDLAFQLWPDAKKDAVVIAPFDLPHVVAACADDVAIPTATLRRMGVNAALLDAIDAAHAGH
ncbi:MAG TPA: hypothetical protein VG939_10755, partial [Caulobacteraceae bacterium]|nr:hypothetical protein [Caulobacteraceae bacterium]